MPNVVRQFVETIDVPLFLLDENLTFLWLNARTRRLLEQGNQADADDGFPEGDISVPMADVVRNRVGEALRSANAWSGDTALIPLPETPDMRLKLYKLVEGGRLFIAGMIVQQSPGTAESTASNLTAYGLTKVEKKIAGQLIRGLTAAEIAIENGSALLTVRTHIKRIYSKMGVNCREKLFAQLLGH